MKTTRRNIRAEENTLIQAASNALAAAGLHGWSERILGGAPDMRAILSAAERLAKHGIEDRQTAAQTAVDAVKAIGAFHDKCARDYIEQMSGQKITGNLRRATEGPFVEWPEPPADFGMYE